MKGKILGFTPAAGSGAISGEDGQRYSFTADQWRSDRQIAVGMAVDFAPDAGAAHDIYPVAGALPAAADLASSEAAQKVRALATTTLAFPLAALLLLATFLPAISTPIKSASLWSLGGLARMVSANPMLANDDVSEAENDLKQLDVREAELRTRGAALGGMQMDIGEDLKSIADERARAQKSLSAARSAHLVTSLLIVRWAVPILAIVLLWFCWSGKEIRRLTLATGAVSIVTALIVYGYRESLVGMGGAEEGSIGGMLSQQMGAVITLGLGTYLIGLLGIGLILAGLGLVRNPLAERTG